MCCERGSASSWHRSTGTATRPDVPVQRWPGGQRRPSAGHPRQRAGRSRGDTAAATGQPWSITGDDLEVVIDGLEQVLLGWLHPVHCHGHTAAYDIRLRGGTAHAWGFIQGTLPIEPPPSGRFDCHLSARPGVLLRVMFRRQPPLTAALTGRVVAWSRRPLRTLANRVHRP